MTGLRVPAVFWCAALVMACSSEPHPQLGVSEPFRVRDGQFVRGSMPGAHLTDGGSPDGGPVGSPQASVTSLATVVVAGQGGFGLSGSADDTAESIALSFDAQGDGYWVVPVEGVDPSQDKKVSWKASVDFGRDLPVGFSFIRVAAIDGNGEAGPQVSNKVCVVSTVYDNFHACSTKRAPPEAVIALEWDTNADLDLQVRTPDGRVIEPKHPIGMTPTDDAGTVPPSAGKFDRDSNASCVIDGVRTENLSWITDKPHGRYSIFVNLFDACKQPSVRFRVSVYTAITNPDDETKFQREQYAIGGELLDFQANGGAARGLFVTEFVFK